MAIPQGARYMTTIQVKSFTLKEYHQLTEIFLSIKIPDFFEKSGI
jgi:hypothetical protein